MPLLLSNWLRQEGLADAGIFEGIEKEVRTEAEAAVQFALTASYPALEEVTQHVYAG